MPKILCCSSPNIIYATSGCQSCYHCSNCLKHGCSNGIYSEPLTSNVLKIEMKMEDSATLDLMTACDQAAKECTVKGVDIPEDEIHALYAQRIFRHIKPVVDDIVKNCKLSFVSETKQ